MPYQPIGMSELTTGNKVEDTPDNLIGWMATQSMNKPEEVPGNWSFAVFWQNEVVCHFGVDFQSFPAGLYYYIGDGYTLVWVDDRPEFQLTYYES